MARATLTEQQIRDFRVRAVAAATRLFAQDGYEAVTMRVLASQLGVSPMTPYRYFESKDDLFVAVRTEAFRRFADTQKAAHESQKKPLLQIKALQRAYVAFALREPDAYRIMFELSQGAAEQRELDAQAQRSFSYLHAAFCAACDEGFLSGDPLTGAHLAWATVHGLVSLQLAHKLKLGRNLTELCEAMVRTFLKERVKR